MFDVIFTCYSLLLSIYIFVSFSFINSFGYLFLLLFVYLFVCFVVFFFFNLILFYNTGKRLHVCLSLYFLGDGRSHADHVYETWWLDTISDGDS